MTNRRAPHWVFDEIIQLTLSGSLNFDIYLRNGTVVNIFNLDMVSNFLYLRENNSLYFLGEILTILNF